MIKTTTHNLSKFLHHRSITTEEKHFRKIHSILIVTSLTDRKTVNNLTISQQTHSLSTRITRFLAFSRSFPAIFSRHATRGECVPCDERGTRNGQQALAVFSRAATKAGIPFHRHVSDLYLARPSRANNMCSLLSIHGSFVARNHHGTSLLASKIFRR